MNRFTILVATAFPLIGLSVASLRGQEAPATLDGGLVRVPNAKVKFAYLRPGTDLTKYKSILFQQLDVPQTVRDTAPKGEKPRIGQSYLLQDKDVAEIQAIYAKSFRNVFNRANFPVVETPQSDTLIVAAQVSGLELKAPLERTRERGGSNVRVFSEGGGWIAIQAVFADGGTGQVIAAAADSKYGNDLWRENTRVRNLQDLQTAFSSWARALEKRLTSPG